MASGFMLPSSSLEKVSSLPSLALSGLGRLATISSAISATSSSDVLPPPPPPVRGCSEMITSSIALVSFVWHEMPLRVSVRARAPNPNPDPKEP